MKKLLHNCFTEVTLTLFFEALFIILMIPIVLVDVGIVYLAITLLVMALLLFMLMLLILRLVINIISSRKLHYFDLNRSFLSPGCVWINQRVKMGRDKTKCPQKEFAKEMLLIINTLPKGTTCYCVTHEDIVKKIKQLFPNAQCTEIYQKQLLKYKRKLKIEKCENCSNSKCSLMQSKKTKFYAVKFII